MDIEQPVHFIGIGGSGMFPLASLLHGRGIAIQGSDKQYSSEIRHLKEKGVKIFSNHQQSNLKGVKTVIYSTAINDQNPEIIRAKELGINILHRSDLLKLISLDYKPIFVAGSHGKTSTAAILAHILKSSNYDPCAVIGGKLLNYGSYHLNGNGEYFIAEADESDGTFLKYQSFLSITTNVDHDHLDHYGTFESLKNAFAKFISNTNVEDGCRIIGWDSAPLRDIGHQLGDFTSFGKVIGCHNRIINVKYESNITKFQLVLGKNIAEFQTCLIGLHNVYNCLAAISAAVDIGVTHQEIKVALKSYKGVGRRLEIFFENPNYTLINDYAHNPGKIRSAISAVRSSYPNSCITAVFQPHRYSRLATMYDLFAESFCESTTTIVLPIYSAGEEPVENINHVKLARDISDLSNIPTTSINGFNEIYKSLNMKPSAHNVILLLGAGDIGVACDLLVEQLRCSKNY